MKRLHHSYRGHLRSMQISSSALFIFVEGIQSDPYFYASICASIPHLHVRNEIQVARQLPGTTGGKQTLLSFFSFLRQNNALISSLGGQRTTCIFFLDKDVDDLQRKKKRSAHVAYTEHYDVQNYMFMHGNLLTAAASAASVDPAKLSAELSDARGWCLRIAKLWREWIALCLCVLEEKISSEANYRVPSRVQTRPCGPTDSTKYDALTRAVARRSGLPVADFRQKIAATTRKVDKCIARGNHHGVFKGKWFATVLGAQLAKVNVIR